MRLIAKYKKNMKDANPRSYDDTASVEFNAGHFSFPIFS